MEEGLVPSPPRSFEVVSLEVPAGGHSSERLVGALSLFDQSYRVFYVPFVFWLWNLLSIYL